VAQPEIDDALLSRRAALRRAPDGIELAVERERADLGERRRPDGVARRQHPGRPRAGEGSEGVSEVGWGSLVESLAGGPVASVPFLVGAIRLPPGDGQRTDRPADRQAGLDVAAERRPGPEPRGGGLVCNRGETVVGEVGEEIRQHGRGRTGDGGMHGWEGRRGGGISDRLDSVVYSSWSRAGVGLLRVECRDHRVMHRRPDETVRPELEQRGQVCLDDELGQELVPRQDSLACTPGRHGLHRLIGPALLEVEELGDLVCGWLPLERAGGAHRASRSTTCGWSRGCRVRPAGGPRCGGSRRAPWSVRARSRAAGRGAGPSFSRRGCRGCRVMPSQTFLSSASTRGYRARPPALAVW